jgi:hypothetical protein
MDNEREGKIEEAHNDGDTKAITKKTQLQEKLSRLVFGGRFYTKIISRK